MINPFLDIEGKATIQRRLPNVAPETVQDYIDDAWAKAIGIAPCIAETTFADEKIPLVVAILRGIILRWDEAQSGALNGKTQMAGPYQQALQFSSQPKRGYVLQPSEIVDLQKLCQKQGRPFGFDTTPEDFESFEPLQGAVVNGNADLNGPAGEWAT